MNWLVLAVAFFFLTTGGLASFDVAVTEHCGKWVTLGEEASRNGFITLHPESSRAPNPKDVPDSCEVSLEAEKGSSLHLRFIMIDFVGCDETFSILSAQGGFDDVLFDSNPYFCGKTIPARVDPVMITFDEASTSYKLRFNKDAKGVWTKSRFLFDYTTRSSDNSDDDLVWPSIPTTASPTTVASTTTAAPITAASSKPADPSTPASNDVESMTTSPTMLLEVTTVGAVESTRNSLALSTDEKEIEASTVSSVVTKSTVVNDLDSIPTNSPTSLKTETTKFYNVEKTTMMASEISTAAEMQTTTADFVSHSTDAGFSRTTAHVDQSSDTQTSIYETSTMAEMSSTVMKTEKSGSVTSATADMKTTAAETPEFQTSTSAEVQTTTTTEVPVHLTSTIAQDTTNSIQTSTRAEVQTTTTTEVPVHVTSTIARDTTNSIQTSTEVPTSTTAIKLPKSTVAANTSTPTETTQLPEITPSTKILSTKQITKQPKTTSAPKAPITTGAAKLTKTTPATKVPTTELPKTTATIELPNTTATTGLPKTTATTELPKTTAGSKIPTTKRATKLPKDTAATKEPKTTVKEPQPHSGPFQCTCSLGFEDSGTHHLLKDLPNIIHQAPYPITVAPGSKACSTAQQKCDDFCKLIVLTKLKGVGLTKSILRDDYEKFGNVSKSEKPKIYSTVGGFVCEKYKSPLLDKGAELYLFSHLPRCSADARKVVLVEKTFCCDGKGNHTINCTVPKTSTASPTPRPTSLPGTTPNANVVTCQCTPQFTDYSKPGNPVKILAPIHTTAVTMRGGCLLADTTCKNKCKRFVGKDDGFSYTQIANDTCGQVYDHPISAYSTLDLHSRLDESRCPAPFHESSAKTITASYCCHKGSYFKCKDLPISVSTTPKYTPSTPKDVAKLIRCQCIPSHFNGTGFVSTEISYPAVLTAYVDYSRGCNSASNLCDRECTTYLTGSKFGWLPKKSITKEIGDSICKKIFAPFNPSMALSDSILDLYSQLDTKLCSADWHQVHIGTASDDFCCTGAGPTSRYTPCKRMTTLPPTTTTSAPRIRCQCIPSHSSDLNINVMDYPAALTVTVDYTRGCGIASTLCNKKCTNYLTGTNTGWQAKKGVAKQIGDSVCAKMSAPFSPSTALSISTLDLYSKLHTKLCSKDWHQAHAATVIDDFCCAGTGTKNQYIPCQSMTTRRPSTKKISLIRCECVPRHYNDAGSDSTEINYPAVQTAYVDYSKGCYSASNLCEKECNTYLTGSKFGELPKKMISKQIGDSVCKKIFAPFNPNMAASVSILDLYSKLDNKLCPKDWHEVHIGTTDDDFCCTGAGFNSRSIPCETMTTKKPPRTRRPATTPASSFRCDCAFGVKYQNSNRYIISKINVTDIALDFSKLYGEVKAATCVSAKTDCKRQCRVEAEDVLNDEKIRTPYGKIEFGEALCRYIGQRISLPIDAVMKSRPTGCGAYYNPGKTFPLDFCCEKDGIAPCDSVFG